MENTEEPCFVDFLFFVFFYLTVIIRQGPAPNFFRTKGEVKYERRKQKKLSHQGVPPDVSESI